MIFETIETERLLLQKLNTEMMNKIFESNNEIYKGRHRS